EAQSVTDGMFAAAAARLAEAVSAEDLAAGSLFPPVSDLRHVTTLVAEAVVRQAIVEGVGRPLPDGAIAASIAALQWEPEYPLLEPADPP
ncbi:MAG TPA: malic enzyme-like NAD(P)-binding protein, partial [Vicinamibacteria bacterium]|nr:malic enzyme-like NAD(P)-binding protein [Vicinamibacteria bacterium]